MTWLVGQQARQRQLITVVLLAHLWRHDTDYLRYLDANTYRF